MSLSRLIASRTFARTGRPTAQLAGVASAVAGGLAPLAAVELPAELQLCRSKMTFTKIGKTHGERATVVPHHPHPHAPHATGAADKPSLNAVLRKFWKLTHPDLFTLFPAQKEINEQSMMVLQGFLAAIKDPSGDSEYPKVRNQQIEFILRTSTSGHFVRAHMLLHLNGNPNKAMVHKSFSDFFRLANLATDFTWDDEYWPRKGPRTAKTQEEEDAEEDYEASGGQGDNESYEEFMNRVNREARRKERRQQQAGQ